MYYELSFLFSPQLEEKAQASEIKAIQTLIKEAGGEIVFEQAPESRTLGYPIAKTRRGLMGTQIFSLENGEKVNSISAKLNLSDKILRVTVIKHKQKPNPSAMKALLASAVTSRRQTASASAPVAMKAPQISAAAAVAAGVPEAAVSGTAKKMAPRKRPAKTGVGTAAKKKKEIKDIDVTISEIVSDNIKV